MYHGDAKETFCPAPWLVPLPSLRRGIPATPKPALAPTSRASGSSLISFDKFGLEFADK